MLKEKLTASVTTDCLCENEDGTPQEYCYGDCYEWQKEDVFELLGQWQVLNNIDENATIVITGSGMTWQRLSGSKVTTFLELHGGLAFGNDFRIEWYLEDGVLTARRWSHDEPTGTGLFEFHIIPEEEEN
jgi:hypothetical protein